VATIHDVIASGQTFTLRKVGMGFKGCKVTASEPSGAFTLKMCSGITFNDCRILATRKTGEVDIMLGNTRYDGCTIEV